ncbi:MAG: hypothetical protein ACP5LA_07305 [Thermoplasmata archaeon]
MMTNEEIEKMIMKLNDKIYELDWEITKLKKYSDDLKYLYKRIEFLENEIDDLAENICVCSYDDIDIKNIINRITLLEKQVNKNDGDDKNE